MYHLVSNILAQLCGSHVRRCQQRTIIKKQRLSLLEGKVGSRKSVVSVLMHKYK